MVCSTWGSASGPCNQISPSQERTLTTVVSGILNKGPFPPLLKALWVWFFLLQVSRCSFCRQVSSLAVRLGISYPVPGNRAPKMRCVRLTGLSSVRFHLMPWSWITVPQWKPATWKLEPDSLLVGLRSRIAGSSDKANLVFLLIS